MAVRTSVLVSPSVCLRRALDYRVFCERYFEDSDVQVVSASELEIADYAVVVTCGFNEESAATSLDVVNYAASHLPPERVLIFGCLPPDVATNLKALGFLYVPPTQYSQIERRLEGLGIRPGTKQSFTKLRGGFTGLSHATASLTSDTYYVLVAEGCAGRCSYCIIKSSIGHIRSRNLPEIRADITRALNANVSKVYPGADDLGAYGIDLGLTFPELLEEILETGASIAGDAFRLELRNMINPEWTVRYAEQLARLFAKYASHIPFYSCALQSGSQHVLSAHKRFDDVNAIGAGLRLIREAIPSAYFFGHLIIGLPGEEIFDVHRTLDFIKSAPVNLWTAFKYSHNKKSPYALTGGAWDAEKTEHNWFYFVDEIKKQWPLFAPTSETRIDFADSFDSGFISVALRPLAA